MSLNNSHSRSDAIASETKRRTTTLADIADLAPSQGNEVLDAVDAFLKRFVVYPSEHARHAHTLWLAHTWRMDEWDSTPRLAFLSPERGSGKTRALEVSGYFVPRPAHSVNASSAYLFRKVSDPQGRPTILYDEVDTVFGPKARDNEDVRGMLNAGHRKGAVAGRCVARGNSIETEEFPAYCAVALAGLKDLPDTIASRSVIIQMRPRAASEVIEPWRDRVNGPEARELGRRLAEWMSKADIVIPQDMPVADRAADVWEALVAIADAAGGLWPARAREAAVAFDADARNASPTMGVQLLV